MQFQLFIYYCHHHPRQYTIIIVVKRPGAQSVNSPFFPSALHCWGRVRAGDLIEYLATVLDNFPGILLGSNYTRNWIAAFRVTDANFNNRIVCGKITSAVGKEFHGVFWAGKFQALLPGVYIWTELQGKKKLTILIPFFIIRWRVVLNSIFVSVQYLVCKAMCNYSGCTPLHAAPFNIYCTFSRRWWWWR